MRTTGQEKAFQAVRTARAKSRHIRRSRGHPAAVRHTSERGERNEKGEEDGDPITKGPVYLAKASPRGIPAGRERRPV